MICGTCKNEIDHDSFYCDQCGVEILICPKCGKTGKGKICTADGTKLILAKDKENGKSETPQPVKPAFVNENTVQSPEERIEAPINTQPSISTQTSGDQISFINNAINIKFNAKHGDIIGRKKGPFADIFGSYKQISGAHAQITYEQNKGWFITDLDSSNGTKYNNAQLQPNIPQLLQNKTYILLANIEFLVQFNSPIQSDDDGEKTIRV